MRNMVRIYDKIHTNQEGSKCLARLTYNRAHLRWTIESLTVGFGKRNVRKALNKVSDVLIVTIGRYWFIHDGTRSVWSSRG